MSAASINELVALCRDFGCHITMEACEAGLVAHVKSFWGRATHSASVYLDANDSESAAKLMQTIGFVSRKGKGGPP